MLRTETREINGHEYACTVFPGRKGFEIQAQLARLVFPIAAGLQLDHSEGDSVMDAGIRFDGEKMVSAIMAGLNPQELRSLCLKLLESTTRDEKSLQGDGFDDAYAANYGEIPRALAFVIEANGFFGVTGEAGGLSGLIQVVSQLASSATGSSATGSSGALSSKE